MRFIPPYFYILAAIASGPAAFPLESFLIAAVISSSVGRCASSSISVRCRMLSIAACEIVDDRFSTSLKCSAHGSSIRLGSVSRVSPPALNIDEEPFARGPYIALRPS